jgi:hypothetical protein
MWSKIFGGVAAISGVTAVIFAATALLDSSNMSESLAWALNSVGSSLDRGDWLLHWRFSSVFLGVVGLAISIAGVAVTLGRRWGLSVISAVAAIAGVFPWVLGAVGFARYAFEAPSALETFALLFVALVTAAAYIRQGHAV